MTHSTKHSLPLPLGILSGEFTIVLPEGQEMVVKIRNLRLEETPQLNFTSEHQDLFGDDTKVKRLLRQTLSLNLTGAFTGAREANLDIGYKE